MDTPGPTPTEMKKDKVKTEKTEGVGTDTVVPPSLKSVVGNGPGTITISHPSLETPTS